VGNEIWQKGFKVEQKLPLYVCGQICCNQCHEFGHTLLCFLSPNLFVLPFYLRGWFVVQTLELSFSFKCDQSHTNYCYEFGHFVVLFKSNIDVQQPILESGLMNIILSLLSSRFNCRTKQSLQWIWRHFIVLLKSNLDVQQTHLKSQFIQQKLYIRQNLTQLLLWIRIMCQGQIL
jgi:hypothetical protein